jgi:pyruvate/oxaloacetate carboxyltransferase
LAALEKRKAYDEFKDIKMFQVHETDMPMDASNSQIDFQVIPGGILSL